MRALLVVTTRSYRAGAFLEALSRLGWEAVVGTERAQALGGLNPAGHLTLDFADLGSAAEVVAEFSNRRPLDLVVGADDDGVLLAALAAERLGLRHASSESVRICRDKILMRRHLAAAGVPGPWFLELDLDEDPAPRASKLAYPCVLKPTSLAGSRGVIRADDPSGFIAAFHRVAAIVHTAEAELEGRPGAPPARMLVEEYLDGEEVALEGVLTAGRLQRLAIFDKPDPLRGPYFEETLYVTPSRHPARWLSAVEACVSEAARAIGLDHGPVHAEVRVSEARATLLEIAPRSIGGLCSRALRFEGAGTLEELLLRHAAGEDVTRLEREHRAAGVLMIPIPRAGTLLEIGGADAAAGIEGVEDVRFVVPPGQEVAPPPEGGRYLGFVFARGPEPSGVEQALRQAHQRLQIRIEPRPASSAGTGHERVERNAC